MRNKKNVLDHTTFLIFTSIYFQRTVIGRVTLVLYILSFVTHRNKSALEQGKNRDKEEHQGLLIVLSPPAGRSAGPPPAVRERI